MKRTKSPNPASAEHSAQTSPAGSERASSPGQKPGDSSRWFALATRVPGGLVTSSPPPPDSSTGGASSQLQLAEVDEVDAGATDLPTVSAPEPDEIVQRSVSGSGPSASQTLARARSALSSAHAFLPHAPAIQRAFGRHDISDLRAKIGGEVSGAAREIGARAFTLGRRIGFRGPPDLHLAAHEATHAVQQARGISLPQRVGAKGDAYERHADDVADAVSAGRSAESLLDRIPASSSAAPRDQLQLNGDRRRTHVPRVVEVTRKMTGEEFKVLALQTLIGDTAARVDWKNIKSSYGPENSPVTVLVDIRLIKTERAASNSGKGISVGSGGAVEGSKARAKAFLSGPMTRAKADLMGEIDDRYYEATGIAKGEKIKSGETAKAQFWNQIRDEVLFQNEYIRDLPEQVKKLIKISTDGRRITARDIDQMFRIAKKIEGMKPGDVADYTSRVSGSTTDLDEFEAAVDVHIAKTKEREKDRDQREAIQTKLYSHGSLYRKYKAYNSLEAIRIPAVDEFGVRDPVADSLRESKADARRELELALAKAGFASIAAFETHIADFLELFQKEALNITFDILDKYRGKLYREGERYKSNTEVTALHAKLGKFREHYREFDKNAEISNAWAQRARTPGPDFTKGPRPRGDPKEAYARAEVAKDRAKAEVEGLQGAHPLLAEDHLPVDRRIDKAKLATASVSGLSTLIREHVAARTQDVEDAKQRLIDNPEQVFKLDKLMPAFYSAMSIQPGDIFDEIVKDKIAAITRKEMVINIVLAVLAIALAIVSYGTATPLIAAGAAAGGLALSSYFIYDEYKTYTTQKDLAAVGFTDDPSMFWLIVACAGAALDLGAAVKAVRALGPAAKTLNAGGDIGDFINAVNHLKKAGKIEAGILEAAEKAALARNTAGQATDELGKIILAQGKLKSFADPKAYEALVQIAKAKIEQGIHSFHQFVLEIYKARKIAGVAGEMSPEQMAKAKEAWEQAVRLYKSAEEPLDILSGSKKIGVFSNGSHLEVISKGTKLHGGNTIHLNPNKTTTITGVLSDTNAVGQRGVKMPGATVMGPNEGGINLLRSPKWPEILEKHKAIREAGDELRYWKTVTDEFWSTVNRPWLEDAIKRGDQIRFISDPGLDTAIYVTRKDGSFVLDASGNKIKSIFGREVDYLKSKGYTWGADGVAVPPKP
ncbi:MAG: DUF4157 domain-containing protein [Enhygromyxa sp.]